MNNVASSARRGRSRAQTDEVFHRFAGSRLAVAALLACGATACGRAGPGESRVAPPRVPASSVATRSPLGAPRSIEVQGHRGARAAFPEDTLPAFQHAMEVGVDTLELDLAVTKDRKLVVMHDLVVNPALCVAADGSKSSASPVVFSATLQEIKSFDCGSSRNPKFPDQTLVPKTEIPTLGEVFELVAKSSLPSAKRVAFNIETKSLPSHPDWTPPAAEFVKLVLAEVRAHGMLARVTLQSFDHRTLSAAKKLEPSLRISALIEGTLPDLPRLAEGLGADVISPNVDWITAGDVDALHAKGVRVIPWTANSEAQWDYLVAIGADGIITDDPKRLVAYLREKKLR